MEQRPIPAHCISRWPFQPLVLEVWRVTGSGSNSTTFAAAKNRSENAGLDLRKQVTSERKAYQQL